MNHSPNITTKKTAQGTATAASHVQVMYYYKNAPIPTEEIGQLDKGNGFARISDPCPNCGGLTVHIHPRGRICGCDNCLKIFKFVNGKIGKEVQS